MKGNRVSKWAILVWEGLLFICWAALMLLATVFLVAFPDIRTAAFVLITMASILLAIVYIPLYYRSVRWLLTEKAVYLRKGFFMQYSQMMRRESINFVSLIGSPLTPIFGICSVKICAAGASSVIPFLPKNTAREIVLSLSPNSEVLG